MLSSQPRFSSNARPRTAFQTVRGILYLLVALGGAAVLLLYFGFARGRGIRFAFAFVPGLTAAVSSLFLLAAVVRLFGTKKAAAQAAVILLSVAAAACTVLALYRTVHDPMLRSVSPDGHTCLLEWDEATGRATYYRQRFFLFCQEKDQLPYTMDGTPKMQWLTDDICAVTYPATDGTTHQFIATYGDRGSGISYYYMAAAIHGSWQVMSRDSVGWKLTADASGITVSNASLIEHYDYSDCVAFGTIALALCRDGLPHWTLCLNEDCSIGSDCLVEKGGTLSLCEVSMERTAPLTLTCIDPKGY